MNSSRVAIYARCDRVVQAFIVCRDKIEKTIATNKVRATAYFPPIRTVDGIFNMMAHEMGHAP